MFVSSVHWKTAVLTVVLAACGGKQSPDPAAASGDTGAANPGASDTGSVEGVDPEEIDPEEVVVGLHETEARYVAEYHDNRSAIVEMVERAAPAFGETVVLPAFNQTPVKRVNELAVGNHLYSQLQAFSKDSRYVLLTEGEDEDSVQWRVRDVSTLAEVRTVSDFAAWTVPRWHPAEDGVLVHYDTNGDDRVRLQHTDVASGETQTVFTFPNEYVRVLNNQSFDEISRDGRWLAGELTTEAGSGTLFSFDQRAMAMGAVLDVDTLYRTACTPHPEYGNLDPDWVGVSPLGRFLMVQWATSGVERCNGLESFDIATGAFVGRVTSDHPHGDMAVLSDGTTEAFVSAELAGAGSGESYAGGTPGGKGVDAWYPSLSYRPLPGPSTGEAEPTYLYLTDWNFEHMSCRGPAGFCLVTSWNNPDNGFYDPLEDEVYILALDGSGLIRLGHHRSSGATYWAQPRASMSADGRFVIFDSDWDQSGPNTSVFVMDLSATTAD